MPIYTGTSDANGDFSIAFNENYTSGEKITVTSQKSLAQKTIELYAPSAVVGGQAAIEFDSIVNFPNNIGHVKLNGFSGTLGSYAFAGTTINSTTYTMWSKATELTINEGVTAIGGSCFYNNVGLRQIHFPDSLLNIGNDSFSGTPLLIEIIIPDFVTQIGNYALNCSANATCKKIVIGQSVTSIGLQAIAGRSGVLEMIVKPDVPPTIQSNTFSGLNTSCVIKVPAESVTAYQAAANWSAFASRIQAI